MQTDLVVIDGDLVAYRAAAANEKRSIIATHKPTGRKKKFDNRTELKEYISDKNFEMLDFEIEDVQEAEDIRFALHSIKTTIKGLCDSCGGNNYIVVVSGEDNFRKSIPLPTQYKSNRKDMTHPLQLKEVKEYILKHHPSEVAIGEADDVLSAYAYKGWKEKKKIVQCSIDKDALSNVGWLYDWTKMSEPIFINGLGELHEEGKKIKGTGRKWFYFQTIVGDPIDGYKPSELCGIKFGDRSAYKLLNDLQTDKECWQAIVDIYKSWYPSPVTYTAWDSVEYTKDWCEIMQMYVDCAHMTRFSGDRVVVKEVIDKLGVTY